MAHLRGSKEADHGPSEKPVETEPPERPNVWVPLGLGQWPIIGRLVKKDLRRFLGGSQKK